MKNLLLGIFALGTMSTWASYTMRDINVDLLLPKVQKDFKLIEKQEESLLRSAVKYLFDQEFIGHIASKSYDPNASFEMYFNMFRSNYHLIDLDKDGIYELVFNGFIDEEKDVESIEIFLAVKNEWLPIFNGKGNLLGYKIQPNTGEVLLYQHIYPCCNNGSHNLNRLRLVGNKFQEVRRFFVGRDSNMKGQFFSKQSKFDGKFYTLKSPITLFWSPEKITKDAWSGRIDENKIAKYPTGTVYSVMAKQGKWKFVLLHGAPVIEANVVINPANFTQTWVYGWIN